MSSKITIIGAGSVGSTIAYTLSSQDIASEIVLIDINKKKAEGEVLDIIQGTCFRDPISIIAGDYEDARDSDIVIITSGIARKPGQTRLELTQTNVNILKSITPEIVKAAPNALYLIVSNPVDIMTYVFTKISGLPENQILGSGTILDSARLRCGLSEHFQIAPRVTPIGKFMRHTSIDELPQLFNILKGNMSLVGPRPERPFFVEKFREEIPRYMVKHQVRPGLTGWAQVNGYRGDTSIRKRIECDLYYIENWSVGFDIKIMFLTIFKGFINKNAY